MYLYYSEEIRTTKEHPFYVEGVGFVMAGSLKEGDVLRLADGRTIEVSGIETEYLSEPVYVYNLEVEDYHTYFVSELGVLVHNNCGSGTGLGGNDGTSTVVPNPNGEKGSKAHQDIITSINPSRTGGKIAYEVRYDTLNGNKKYRYADAVEISNGKITSIHQVGKINQNGTPVIRESQAIADIMSSPDYNGAPIYF